MSGANEAGSDADQIHQEGPPRRCYRWFPGWTMLGISAAAQYMSAPGQSYSVAAFKDPMQTGLNVSETQYSLAYACATVVSAGLLPYVGRLVDRFGARVMLPIIATGLGIGCWMMSSVDSLTELYFGFGIVRSLGQGALSLLSAWIVGEWFEHRRGIATAMAGLGGGLSVMTIPLINNWFIENYSWQTAWQALACAVWVLLILPGIVILRDRPEDLGLHPDGIDPNVRSPDGSDTATSGAASTAMPVDRVADGHATASLQNLPPAAPPLDDVPASGPQITSYEDSWTVDEVLRNATFWKLVCVPATSGLVGTGLVMHQVKLLERNGLDRTESLLLMTLQAGCATLMQFPAGWLTDRVPSRYILAAAMMFLATATLLAINMPFIWLAGLYALLLGLHGSVMRSTATVVWINYYGRAHQGAVRGVAWSAMILAAAIGPLPLAVSNDYFGSYEPALIVFLALPLLAAIAVWTAHPPQRGK
ncbi:MAG: MFS transporter [Rhodopirellula sp.]|nr:MFS transporter [Rhodopirellula sp.]